MSPAIKDSLAHKMPFGKFKGQPLAHIMAVEPDYLQWLATIDLREPHKTHVNNVVQLLDTNKETP